MNHSGAIPALKCMLGMGVSAMLYIHWGFSSVSQVQWYYVVVFVTVCIKILFCGARFWVCACPWICWCCCPLPTKFPGYGEHVMAYIGHWVNKQHTYIPNTHIHIILYCWHLLILGIYFWALGAAAYGGGIVSCAETYLRSNTFLWGHCFTESIFSLGAKWMWWRKKSSVGQGTWNNCFSRAYLRKQS